MKGSGCIFSKSCTDIIEVIPYLNNILRTISVVCNKSPLDLQLEYYKNKYRPFIKYCFDKFINITTILQKVTAMNNYINTINTNSMSSIEDICMYNFIISEKIKEPFAIDNNIIIFYYDNSCIKFNQSKNIENQTKSFLKVTDVLNLSTIVDKKVPTNSACSYNSYNKMTKETSPKLCNFFSQNEKMSLLTGYTLYSSSLNKNTLLGFITKQYQLYFTKYYNNSSIAKFNLEFLQMFKAWHSFQTKEKKIITLFKISNKKSELPKLIPINKKQQAPVPASIKAQQTQVALQAVQASIKAPQTIQQAVQASIKAPQTIQQAVQASIKAPQTIQQAVQASIKAPQTIQQAQVKTQSQSVQTVQKIQQAQVKAQVALQASVQAAQKIQQAQVKTQAQASIKAPQTKNNTLKSNNITLYSGGSILFERHGYPITNKEGENIYLLTLLSTSTCYKTALRFSKSCIYIITVPNELIKVLIPVENCTSVPTEYEIILPIGSILQVTKVVYKNNKYTIEAELQPYNMEIIDRFIDIFKKYSNLSGGSSNSEKNLAEKRQEHKNNYLGFISDEDKLNLLFTDLVIDYNNILKNRSYTTRFNINYIKLIKENAIIKPVIYVKYTDFDIGLLDINELNDQTKVDQIKYDIKDLEIIYTMFYSKDQTQVDKIKEFKYKQWYIYKKQQENTELVEELNIAAQQIKNNFDD
jgi:hypothetical protein